MRIINFARQLHDDTLASPRVCADVVVDGWMDGWDGVKCSALQFMECKKGLKCTTIHILVRNAAGCESSESEQNHFYRTISIWLQFEEENEKKKTQNKRLAIILW